MRFEIVVMVAGGSLALLGLAGESLGQAAVWVVDDDGGAGVDFTDIQDAVDAAADTDTVLVKSGSYSSFSVSAKTLNVIGDAGAAIEIGGINFVVNLTSQQSVLLQNLDFTSDPGLLPLNGVWDFRDSSGPIWMESCTGEVFTSSNCSAVAALRCQFDSDEAFSGVSATNSTVNILDSEARAGQGTDGFVCIKFMLPHPGGLGPDAVRTFAGSQVFLSGTLLEGGTGGTGLPPTPCSDGGPGGAALNVSSSLSQPIVQDTTLLPGAGGTGGTGCSDGAAGAGVQPPLAGPNPLVNITGTLRTMSIDSPVREGETATLEIDGEIGDQLFLFLSVTQSHAFVLNLRGAVLVGPGIVLGPVPMPGDGSPLQIPIVAPELGPGVESGVLYFGAGFTNGPEKILGSSTAWVILDDSF